MAFEFTHAVTAKLSSVNVRSEKHGPELVPAVDLKLAIDASNDILAKFHPDLKASLYYKAEPDADDQEELDGIDPVTNLPNLRFPRLDGPLKWDIMGIGYHLSIDFGLGGDSNLELHGCEINNFAFSCKEGGTVELAFRAQITNIDEQIIGKLAILVQHEVTITLLAPKVSEHDYDDPPLLSNPFPVDGGSEPVVDPFTPELAFAAAHAEAPVE
jgi:hypothetical protein